MRGLPRHPLTAGEPALPWRRLGQALALGGLLAIALATLTPSDDPHAGLPATPLLCLVCGEQGGADVAGNLLLFIPFALGLRLSGWPWRRCVAAAAGVSFTVELLQFLVVRGRDASLSDLVTNTTSGALGAWLGGVAAGLLFPPPARVVRLMGAGLAVAVGSLVASAWLLGVDLPPGPLTSGWAHVAPGDDVFDGRVQAATLNGVGMPPNAAPLDSARIRREVAGGETEVEVQATSGGPTGSRAWIYMLRTPQGGAVTLSQLHRLAIYAAPARALRFRFWPPTVSLADGLPEASGAPVTLRVSERHRRVTLSSEYQGQMRSVTLAITPAYGWVLVSPFQLGVGTGVRWMSALCLALLFLPSGYWASWSRRPARASAAVVVGVGLAVGMLPPVFGFPPAPGSEWLGALAGAGAGWALGRAAAYLQTRCASPSASEFSSP